MNCEWHCDRCGYRAPADEWDANMVGVWEPCPKCPRGIARVEPARKPKPTRGPLAPWLKVVCALLMVIGCVPETTHVAAVPFGAVPESALAPLLDDEGRRCNAGAIGSGVLVTAAHCYPEGERRSYTDGDTWAHSDVWTPRRARLVRADRQLDYALLAPEAGFGEWLGVRMMRRGEIVAAIVWRDEEWVALPDTSGEPGHFDGVVPIRKGDSGSPVVGVDGSLLGVVTTCTWSKEKRVCLGGGTWRPVGDLL